MSNQKIIILGPCSSMKEKSNTGGCIVLFEEWIDFCNKKSIDYLLIDTNKKNYRNKVFATISIFISFIRNVCKCEKVFLHGSFKDYLILAPFIVFLCKILKKQIFLRKFAGSFNFFYSKSNFIKKTILNKVLKKADMVFWETKELTDFWSKKGIRSFWFPNTRLRLSVRESNKKYQKRFVFISRVTKEKGVEYLKDSFSQLGNDYSLDFYGPLSGYNDSFFIGDNYNYKGCLDSSNVCSVLSEYDVLVLPTFWKSEGYPGIIIEAFSVGIPIISTAIGGIPELIKNGVNGFLIKTHSTEEIIKAVTRINKSNYSSLAKESYDSFANFDGNIVNNNILKLIMN
ncbi:glycosyltransferase [Bacteroides sp.]|uniref:glycosyltransferase n=1 Tax=Bacteroides sp. TaxID=29523 RepID=UPI00258FED39|nr:glycosyltransferase [Bacteroides sp.]